MNAKMAIFLTAWHQNSIPIAIIKTPDLNYKRFDFSYKMSKEKKRKEKKLKEKGKIPTWPYRRGHNWLTHMLCHQGTELSTLQRSVCTVQHYTVNVMMKIPVFTNTVLPNFVLTNSEGAILLKYIVARPNFSRRSATDHLF
jgi:hypothetical protein